jgi:hypothetical protein
MVSQQDIQFFQKSGYLIVRDLLSSQEVQNLMQWTKEVQDWEPTPDSDFMPYEVRDINMDMRNDTHDVIFRKSTQMVTPSFAEPRIM